MAEQSVFGRWCVLAGLVVASGFPLGGEVATADEPISKLQETYLTAEKAVEESEKAKRDLRKAIEEARRVVNDHSEKIRQAEDYLIGFPAITPAGIPPLQVEAVPESVGLVPAAATAPSIANKVHVLIIALPAGYQDPLTPGARANVNFIREHLNYNSQGRAEIHEIGMADFEPQKTLARLRSLNVTANDTLFVYVALHGNFDGTLRDGHQFQIRNQFLTRKNLREAINASPARQKILMTDSCSPDGRQNITAIQFESIPRPAPSKWPLSRLLLYHSQPDLIDITAASEGQIAVFRSSSGPDGGGLFTRSFIEASYSADESGRWEALFAETRRRTEDAYQRLPQKVHITVAGRGRVKQLTQTPLRF